MPASSGSPAPFVTVAGLVAGVAAYRQVTPMPFWAWLLTAGAFAGTAVLGWRIHGWFVSRRDRWIGTPWALAIDRGLFALGCGGLAMWAAAIVVAAWLGGPVPTSPR